MFVVNLDQRDSRHNADRVPRLLEELAGVPTVARFERTAGDEVQGLLDDPAAVRIALLTALRDGDWHCGVGVGAVDPDSFAAGTRAGRGAAYLAARAAVDDAKSVGSSVAIRTDDDPGATWAADCEAVWHLVAALVTDRTEAQWRVVDAVDAHPTQAAAAEHLGIAPSSVTGALRASRIREERAAYPALERLLAGTAAACTGKD